MISPLVGTHTVLKTCLSGLLLLAITGCGPEFGLDGFTATTPNSAAATPAADSSSSAISLAPGNDYMVRVRALSTDGSIGPWSSAIPLTPAQGSSTAESTLDDAFVVDSLQVDWPAQADAEAWEIIVERASDNKRVVHRTVETAELCDAEGTCSIKPEFNAPSGIPAAIPIAGAFPVSGAAPLYVSFDMKGVNTSGIISTDWMLSGSNKDFPEKASWTGNFDKPGTYEFVLLTVDMFGNESVSEISIFVTDEVDVATGGGAGADGAAGNVAGTGEDLISIPELPVESDTSAPDLIVLPPEQIANPDTTQAPVPEVPEVPAVTEVPEVTDTTDNSEENPVVDVVESTSDNTEPAAVTPPQSPDTSGSDNEVAGISDSEEPVENQGAQQSTDEESADNASSEEVVTTVETSTDTGEVSTIPEESSQTGPVISNITVTDVGETQVTIAWDLDDFATGVIEYGLDKQLGQWSAKENSFNWSSHRQTLGGLQPGTTYYFRVHADNEAGESSVSEIVEFTTGGVLEPSLVDAESTDNASSEEVAAAVEASTGTVDVSTTPDESVQTGPVISNITVAHVSDQQAAIAWDLDDVATGVIEYGPDKQFGQWSVKDESFNWSSHRQTLNGLQAETTYYFRVHAENEAGESSFSDTVEFTTEAIPEPSLVDTASSLDFVAYKVSATPQVANDSQCIFPQSESVMQSHWVEYDSGQAVPDYKSRTPETASNTTLTRVSSNSAFGVGNGSAKHAYSKRQAWNADQTLLDIGNRTVDVSTLNIVNGYIPITNERNWSNLDPNVVMGIRYNPEPNEFVAANVVDNSVKVLHRFEGFNACTVGDYEGNVTNDDGRVVLACTKKSNGQRTLISYDITNDVILGTMNAAHNFNWAGFSQTGAYIVVENNTYPDPSPVMIRYNPDFSSPLALGGPAHGDFGFDDNGDEIYAMIRWDVIDYYRLKDGLHVALPVTNNDNPMGHGHLSCRNSGRPGWCYFSSYGTWRIGAVKMSATNSVVELWGFHRSNSLNYISQPQASASRSGDSVLFTSQWYGRGEINDYTFTCQKN